jgi:hypothetical protein
MTLPVWGLCRHGLVTGERLQFANGSDLFYGQPAPVKTAVNVNTAMAETYGHTLPVRVPGVPPVVRSTGDAADDYARGYVWQDMALLSGGSKRLSNRSLGENSWIYCAPGGSRWHVQLVGIAGGTAYALNTPLNFTMRLKRFGELLGQPDQFDYPMTLSNFGKDNGSNWPGSLTTARLLVANCNDGGSRAILEAASFFNAATGQRATDQRQVFAFHEFTLSGTPGVDFVPALALLLPASGVVVETQVPVNLLTVWFAGWEGSGDPWYSGPVLPNPRRNVQSAPWGIGTAKSAGYRVVGFWYDSLGATAPVKLMIELNKTLNRPEPTPVYTSTSSWTVDARVQWGAVVTPSVRYSGHSVGGWDYPNSATFSGQVTMTYVHDYDAGIPDRAQVTNYTLTDLFGVGLVGAGLPDRAITIASGLQMGFGVARLSNNVFSVQHITDVGGTTGTSYRTIFPPLTPSGPVAGSPIRTATTHGIRYGSHNLATGETTWGSTAPVCYV